MNTIVRIGSAWLVCLFLVEDREKKFSTFEFRQKKYETAENLLFEYFTRQDEFVKWDEIVPCKIVPFDRPTRRECRAFDARRQYGCAAVLKDAFRVLCFPLLLEFASFFGCPVEWLASSLSWFVVHRFVVLLGRGK